MTLGINSLIESINRLHDLGNKITKIYVSKELMKEIKHGTYFYQSPNIKATFMGILLVVNEYLPGKTYCVEIINNQSALKTYREDNHNE